MKGGDGGGGGIADPASADNRDPLREAAVRRISSQQRRNRIRGGTGGDGTEEIRDGIESAEGGEKESRRRLSGETLNATTTEPGGGGRSCPSHDVSSASASLVGTASMMDEL